MLLFLNSVCAVKFCLSIPCLLSHALLLCQNCRSLCAVSQPTSPVPICNPRKTSALPDFSFAFCYNIRVVLLLYFSKLLYTAIFLIPSGELSWQNWVSVLFTSHGGAAHFLYYFCTRAMNSLIVSYPECCDSCILLKYTVPSGTRKI